jgi:hypothetical protein
MLLNYYTFTNWGKAKRVAQVASVAFILVFSSSKNLRASETSEKISSCYQLHKESAEKVKDSGLYLCMTYRDLKKYPKSVVSFTLYNVKTKSKIKRHYTHLGQFQFGRKADENNHSLVKFNQGDSTVFLSFSGDENKTFFYREVPFRDVGLSKREIAGSQKGE